VKGGGDRSWGGGKSTTFQSKKGEGVIICGGNFLSWRKGGKEQSKPTRSLSYPNLHLLGNPKMEGIFFLDPQGKGAFPPPGPGKEKRALTSSLTKKRKNLDFIFLSILRKEENEGGKNPQGIREKKTRSNYLKGLL